MNPAQPPLPTDWSLPFHPEKGSQTSILISESLEGLSVAATRQNAGSLPYAAAGDSLGPGGINSPAPTLCAEVIVVFACERVARLSQEAATADDALDAVIGRTPKTTTAIPPCHLLLENTVRPASPQTVIFRSYRHAALQFFEPVEHQVDLCGGRTLFALFDLHKKRWPSGVASQPVLARSRSSSYLEILFWRTIRGNPVLSDAGARKNLTRPPRDRMETRSGSSHCPRSSRASQVLSTRRNSPTPCNSPSRRSNSFCLVSSSCESQNCM